MAGHEYKNCLMSLTAVLILVGECQCDLKLKMDRIGSESFCGHLHCWNHDKLDNATSITAIRVYNITHPQVKMEMANVTRDGSGVEINQLSSSVINGTGRIDGFNANLSINFKSSQDCEFGSFLCELEYVDVNGEKHLMTAEDRASSSNKCTCSSINSQMSNLTEKVEDNTRQISSLRENNSALSTEIKDLSENDKILTNELLALRQDYKTQSVDISTLRQDILTNNLNRSAELIALRQINITLSKEIADLRQENKKISTQMSGLKLTADISALLTELLVLRKDNTNLSTELFDLKQDHTALSTELSDLKINNTLQYTELSAVTQDLKFVSTKLTDLTQNNTALSTELSALRQNNTALSSKLSAFRQNNTALSIELSTLRQQNSNQLLQIQNLSSQILQTQNCLTSVQTVTTTSPTTKRITTPALGSECSRGMSHSNPRVKFLLWGQIPALCDTETDGGGWVIIQRRTKGDVDFYRDWQSYKTGFGTPDTDFWLGNDVIQNLTLRGFRELRVDMIFNKTQLYAQYDVFTVDNENQNYRLTVSGYRGTAGDSLAYSNNMMFSTYDRDNDKWSGNCATMYRGAWWYLKCYDSNLNGAWGVNGQTGIKWYALSYTTALTSNEMKVRL